MASIYGVYTKEKFLKFMETMDDDKVVMITSHMHVAESKPRLKVTQLEFQFPHEMMKNPDTLKPLLTSHLVCLCICEREKLSDKFNEDLKKTGSVLFEVS